MAELDTMRVQFGAAQSVAGEIETRLAAAERIAEQAHRQARTRSPGRRSHQSNRAEMR